MKRLFIILFLIAIPVIAYAAYTHHGDMVVTGDLEVNGAITENSAALVLTSGNQTIAGVKTFSSFPVTPSSAPTTDYQVANMKYVDDNGGSLPSGTDGQMIQYSGTTPTAVDSIGSVAFSMGGTRSNLLFNTGVPLTIAGTSALGTSAIASGACATTVTTTATDTATTDVVNWGFNGDPTSTTGYSPTANGMLTIISWPSANNVNFDVCNLTAASITPGSVTLNWRVIK